jgi:hypothetical protein
LSETAVSSTSVHDPFDINISSWQCPCLCL